MHNYIVTHILDELLEMRKKLEDRLRSPSSTWPRMFNAGDIFIRQKITRLDELIAVERGRAQACSEEMQAIQDEITNPTPPHRRRRRTL